MIPQSLAFAHDPKTSWARGGSDRRAATRRMPWAVRRGGAAPRGRPCRKFLFLQANGGRGGGRQGGRATADLRCVKSLALREARCGG